MKYNIDEIVEEKHVFYNIFLYILGFMGFSCTHTQMQLSIKSAQYYTCSTFIKHAHVQGATGRYFTYNYVKFTFEK